MPSYQYRKFCSGDKMVIISSYLHYEISSAGTMPSLYWVRPCSGGFTGVPHSLLCLRSWVNAYLYCPFWVNSSNKMWICQRNFYLTAPIEWLLTFAYHGLAYFCATIHFQDTDNSWFMIFIWHLFSCKSKWNYSFSHFQWRVLSLLVYDASGQ